jgi:malate dehydrogenase (oxaloacetate-decarboxylating)
MDKESDALDYRRRYRGLIGVRSKMPIRDVSVLSRIYTPGVGAVCKEIARNPASSYRYTCRGNSIALISDGSQVYEFGNIGAAAVLPKLEAKSVIYKTFANVDAVPIALKTQDPYEIIEIVRVLAPSFGGFCLESIAAPKCFTIENRIRHAVRVSVLHHENHASGIIVLAALYNALKVVGKRLEDVTIVTTGVGAAGVATTDALLAAGARRIIGCDHEGAVYRGRPGLAPHKEAFAERTNPDGLECSADDALEGADVYIGLSVPGAVTAEGVGRMAKDAIVFAMANPTPEVEPEAIHDVVAVVATGRSDYPNQINNVLAFPGVFRGALDVRASAITSEMKVAAARAIASVIPRGELGPEYVVPSVFNRDVTPRVAAEVAAAAERSGVARHPRPHS